MRSGPDGSSGPLSISFPEPAPEAPRGPSRIEIEDFLFEDKRVSSAPSDSGRKPGAGIFPSPGGPTSGLEIPDGAVPVQESLFGNTDLTPEEDERILLEENLPRFRIIGQLFETYWLIQYEDRLLVIDQHAAHEKVNFERLMKRLENSGGSASGSQLLAPASVITLTGREEGEYLAHRDVFASMGYEIEPLGETLEEMIEEKLPGTPKAVIAKIASMSCKAAVKGNSLLSVREAEALIDELLKLDNPYHCPHGRPTMIVFSKEDMEKKFKRIVT